MQPANNPINEEFLQQNPVYALIILLVTGLALTGLFASLLSWIFLFVRRSQGKPILPIKLPWQPRQWSLVEVLGIIVGALLLNAILASALARALNIERGDGIPLELAAAGGVGSLLSVILGTLWICTRYQVGLAHVGFDRIRIRTIVIGVIAGLVSLPGMYLMMMIVSALSETKYEHPLIDSTVESATLFGYLMAVFAAAIVAPIAEEFFFRVVLQGWLQSIPFKNFLDNVIGRLGSGGLGQDRAAMPMQLSSQGDYASATVVSAELQPTASSADRSGSSTLSSSESLASSIGSPSTVASIYEPSTQLVTAQLADNPIDDSNIVPPIWPCILSGLLFGFAHFDYGMSFIPLSFLGIFLGWLYRQTQSIWPCIIVHMMLNSFSMIMLGIVILLKQAGVEVAQ